MRIVILPSLMDRSLCRQVTEKYRSPTHCGLDVALSAGKDPEEATESAFGIGGQENLIYIVSKGQEGESIC